MFGGEKTTFPGFMDDKFAPDLQGQSVFGHRESEGFASHALLIRGAHNFFSKVLLRVFSCARIGKTANGKRPRLHVMAAMICGTTTPFAQRRGNLTPR